MKAHSASPDTKRVSLLRSACETTDIRLAQQEPIMATSKAVARQYRGRSLGTGRRLRLSPKSLYRLYHEWLRAGRNDKAFQLRYRAGKPRQTVDPHLVRAITNYCIADAQTVGGALTTLRLRGDASSRALYRALPAIAIKQYAQTVRRFDRQGVALAKRRASELARLNRKILAAV